MNWIDAEDHMYEGGKAKLPEWKNYWTKDDEGEIYETNNAGVSWIPIEKIPERHLWSNRNDWILF